MKIVDLGAIEGEIVLAGGILSNRAALDAFEAAVAGRPVLLTGDTAGYGADPAGCLERVRDLGWPGIAGNVERQLAADAEGCGCGFDAGTTCDRLSAAWYAHARAAVTPDLRDWMTDLPDILTFTNAGQRVSVIHGGVTDIARFLWPSSHKADFAREIDALVARTGPINTVVAGHAGIAFHRVVAGVRWINPGSIGLPPHDGRPETRFAVLKDNDVVIHRLAYDHAAARAAMQTAGLTQGYHDTLGTGLWPSEDTLPPALRR
jgi:predicted phosphodiesterase